ncbi:putative hydroxypyruvate isomerase [Macrosteles quadrilineatus]|uniref:putative hydroxypyruvate isomerase n=1 Tax=Macrosteles quadrilineatus TaxID=74068 RepID=UPI0023E17FD2|nr:putative hydroxypyruvate isomerase [Macrosteles quadrilineatus]XP_054290655.1 putative hydroxypyruvate isomerase [Macrosteles quadrilineatus]XP_054290656.1 putative hydroxypyruvate isomerase [Macrosteles quadrilineatus]
MTLKFCANLSFMYHESASLLERYHLAKQSGFRAVECAFPYSFPVEEVKRAKESAQVEQVLLNVNPGDLEKGELGFAALPGQQDRFRSSLDQAILYSKALDCKLIHIMAGKVTSPSEENIRVYEENLIYASSLLKENNIVGVIEPINSISIPGYYLNSYRKALQIVKNINSPNIKLLADLFHWQMMKVNLVDSFRESVDYIGHVQIAQAPHRNEPDTEGEIDFKAIFSFLESQKYNGWIGLEYKPLTNTQFGLKWIVGMGYSL